MKRIYKVKVRQGMAEAIITCQDRVNIGDVIQEAMGQAVNQLHNVVIEDPLKFSVLYNGNIFCSLEILES